MDTAGLLICYYFIAQTLTLGVLGQGDEGPCTTPSIFTAPTATITSPSYPSEHGHNLQCTYIITVEGATNVNIEFNSFHLEYKLDFLRLGAGTEVGQDEFDRQDYISKSGFTGDMDIQPLTIQGNSVWIVFTSDVDVAFSGFSLTYSTSETCPPGYQYGNAGHCYKFVSIPATWHEARLDCQTTPGSDLVSINSDTTAGNDQEISYISSAIAAVEFWTGLSDLSVNQVWRWIPVKCGAFTELSRWAQGEPSNQNGDEDCATLNRLGSFRARECERAYPYVCEVNAGANRVDVPSVTASAQSSSSILVNWLIPIDICVVNGYQIMYHRSDWLGGASFIDVGSPLTSSKVIDNLQSGTNYTVYVASRLISGDLQEFVPIDGPVETHQVTKPIGSSAAPSSPCGGSVAPKQGSVITLTSPNYPKDYDNNIYCEWTITAAENFVVIVYLGDLNTENEYDWLDIGEGSTPTDDSRVFHMSGLDRPIEYWHSDSNQVWITFTSDYSNTAKGFYVWITAIAADEVNPRKPIVTEPIQINYIYHDEIVLLSGGSVTISSPNYPQPYDIDNQVYWRVRTSSGKRMQVSFLVFDTEEYYDWLLIGDGHDYSDVSTGVVRQSGRPSPLPAPFTSVGDKIWLTFLSDHTHTAQGFSLYIREIDETTQCGGELVIQEGVSQEITSPNHPGNYKNDDMCRWTLTTANGADITVSIDTFSSEKFHDTLEIGTGIDGMEASSRMLRFSGTDVEGSYPMRSSAVWVIWRTDSSVTDSGFLIQLSAGSEDQCDANPCENGGTCVVVNGQPTCICASGFIGDTCDTGPIDLTPCFSNPCLNGGTCNNVGDTTYQCNCMSGWQGDNCETAVEVGVCDSSPCLNGGTCVEVASDGYVCLCRTGFTGTTCEINLNECSSSPCMNGGVCIDQEGRFVCLCPPGFGGTLCETDLNECISQPCRNGGTCVDVQNGYICICDVRYTGTNCESGIDYCASRPCQNGGTCNTDTNGYMCTCLTGYVGSDCETDARPCNSIPCQNGGYCLNEPDNTYICACPAEWSGDNCEIASTNCLSQPCMNGGTCGESPDGYFCVCPLPYTGNICNQLFDACSVAPCLNGGTCNNFMTYSTCSCPPLWTGVICQTYLGHLSTPEQQTPTKTPTRAITPVVTTKLTTERKTTEEAPTAGITKQLTTDGPIAPTEERTTSRSTTPIKTSKYQTTAIPVPSETADMRTVMASASVSLTTEEQLHTTPAQPLTTSAKRTSTNQSTQRISTLNTQTKPVTTRMTTSSAMSTQQPSSRQQTETLKPTTQMITTKEPTTIDETTKIPLTTPIATPASRTTPSSSSSKPGTSFPSTTVKPAITMQPTTKEPTTIATTQKADTTLETEAPQRSSVPVPEEATTQTARASLIPGSTLASSQQSTAVRHVTTMMQPTTKEPLILASTQIMYTTVETGDIATHSTVFSIPQTSPLPSDKSTERSSTTLKPATSVSSPKLSTVLGDVTTLMQTTTKETRSTVTSQKSYTAIKPETQSTAPFSTPSDVTTERDQTTHKLGSTSQKSYTAIETETQSTAPFSTPSDVTTDGDQTTHKLDSSSPSSPKSTIGKPVMTETQASKEKTTILQTPTTVDRDTRAATTFAMPETSSMPTVAATEVSRSTSKPDTSLPPYLQTTDVRPVTTMMKQSTEGHSTIATTQTSGTKLATGTQSGTTTSEPETSSMPTGTPMEDVSTTTISSTASPSPPSPPSTIARTSPILQPTTIGQTTLLSHRPFTTGVQETKPIESFSTPVDEMTEEASSYSEPSTSFPSPAQSTAVRPLTTTIELTSDSGATSTTYTKLQTRTEAGTTTAMPETSQIPIDSTTEGTGTTPRPGTIFPTPPPPPSSPPPPPSTIARTMPTLYPTTKGPTTMVTPRTFTTSVQETQPITSFSTFDKTTEGMSSHSRSDTSAPPSTQPKSSFLTPDTTMIQQTTKESSPMTTTPQTYTDVYARKTFTMSRTSTTSLTSSATTQSESSAIVRNVTSVEPKGTVKITQTAGTVTQTISEESTQSVTTQTSQPTTSPEKTMVDTITTDDGISIGSTSSSSDLFTETMFTTNPSVSEFLTRATSIGTSSSTIPQTDVAKNITDGTDYSSPVSTVTMQTPTVNTTFDATEITATTSLVVWSIGTDYNPTKYVSVAYFQNQGSAGGFDTEQWFTTIKVPREPSRLRLTGLQPNTEYRYRLQLEDDNFNAVGTTDTKYFTTKLVPLPVNVIVTNIDDTSATITWIFLDDTALIETFVFRMQEADSDDWFAVNIPGDMSPIIELTDLSPATKYQLEFVVTAADGGATESTPIYEFTTLKEILIPDHLQVVNIKTREATLTWMLNENSTTDGSIVQVKLADIPSSRYVDSSVWQNISFIEPHERSYTLTELSPGTEYNVRLLSSSENGTQFKATDVVTFETQAVPLPTNVIISDVTSDSARIAWIIEDEQLIGQITLRYKRKDEDSFNDAPVVPLGNTTTLTGLQPGNEYTFNLEFVSNDGQQHRTTQNYTFVTSPRVIPLPINVTITDITKNSAKVSWTYPQDTTNIGNISVQYKSGDANEWHTMKTSFPTQSVTLTSLESNMEYSVYLVVESVDGQDSSATEIVAFNSTPGVPLPRSVTVTDITSSTATVSWLLPLYVIVGHISVNYQIRGQETWLNVSVTPPTDSVVLEDLSPDETYMLYLVVVSTSGEDSRVTQPISFKTTSALPTPSDVMVDDVTENSARISWTLPDNIDQIGQVVFQYRKADGQWQNVSLTPDTNTFVLSGLDPASTYTFRFDIRSKDGNERTLTPEYTFTTRAELLLPEDITIVNKTTNQATVTWTLPLGSSVHSSIVEYRQTGMESWTASGELDNSTTAFTMVGLSANTEYSVRLVSKNSDGSRVETTDEIVFVTHAIPLPTDITVSNITDDGAEFSWTIPEDEDLVGSIVLQYRTDENGTWQNITVTPPDNSVELTDLEPNTNYEVRLVVKTQDGNHTRISPVTSFTTRTTLSLPYDVKVQNITTNKATVTWTMDPDSTIPKFVLQYKSEAGDEPWINVTLASIAVTDVTLNDLSANTEYSVRFLGTSDNGSFSESTHPIMFSTKAVPLPVDVKFSNVTEDSVRVTWTIPEDEDLIGNIIVQYKMDSDNEWENVTVVPPINTAQISDLEPNSDYNIRLIIVAQNGQDFRITPTSSVKTLAEFLLPDDITIVNKTTNQATVTWTLPLGSSVHSSIVEYRQTGMESWTTSGELVTLPLHLPWLDCLPTQSIVSDLCLGTVMDHGLKPLMK
ncbi:uncharacterized protein [Ptychodera flava]|uniref:uncharacterized protein isoform X2 n=1 Tax=Ptychodera flava TaxID=63121 RepID=UPI00396A6492